jgi:predicted AlkP superfamily phosphohydrolase/phosphomutase
MGSLRLMQSVTHISTRQSNSSQRKVFFLDIDATSLHFLKANFNSLPNLSRLFGNGRVIETETSARFLSATSWQTFASGILPGEHGHYFPLQWNPKSMRFSPVKGNTLRFEPFWNKLARDGVKTIAFDVMSVPLTQESESIQVLNWNTQCNFVASSNRQALLQTIKRKFGNKPIGDEVTVRKSRKMLARHRDNLITSLRKKTDAILFMMKEYEWQFFLTAYYEGHRAGHNLYPIWEEFASDPPEEAMLDVYRELDTQLGRLLSALDLSDTVLVLFSMHGMAPGYAQDHFLPAVVDRINRLYADRAGLEGSGSKRGIARLLRQTVPAPVQFYIRQVVGQEIQDWLVDREWRGGKDWKRTPAFPVPCGGDVGFIRLNIIGRESEGCLPPSEKDRAPFVEFLCRQLRALRVKQTDEPLVRDIVMTRDMFPGPRSYLLPDLLVVWQPKSPASEIWSQELGTITAHLKTGRGGNHTGDSFAVLVGAIQDDEELPPLRHLVDYKDLVTSLLRGERAVAV